MSSTIGADYTSAISNFQTLCTKLRDLNAKMNYPDTDRRHASLQSLMKICMWIQMELEDFIPHMKDTSELMKRFGLSKEDSIQFGLSISVYQKASFITLFMFQIENLLKIIRNELPNLSNSNKFYNISHDVLSVTNPREIKEKHDILRCPAMVRNCLHSSGTHTQQTETLQVGSRTFDFVEDKTFNDAGWDSIYFMVNALVDVLQEILDTNNVKNLMIPK